MIEQSMLMNLPDYQSGPILYSFFNEIELFICPSKKKHDYFRENRITLGIKRNQYLNLTTPDLILH
jgi:hypothetical protein